MDGAAGPYASASFRRLTAARLGDSDADLANALLGAARVLERHAICRPLRYAGDPPRPIEPSAGAILDYLAKVRDDRERGLPSVFRLSGEPPGKSSALFLEFEAAPDGRIEAIWITLQRALAEVPGAAERLPRALAELGSEFGAYHAAAEDEQLMQLYRGVRAAERARSAVPPELRQYVPEPQPPVGAAGRLPSLLVPQEFDRRRVPEAVWWINFWDRVQVETVGRAKIRTAPFARVGELASGALLLVATDEATDGGNPAHIDRLAGILEHLDLRGLQERARY
jgi:hypothetical protein